MSYSIVSYSPERAVELSLSMADASRLKDRVVWIDLANPTEGEINELKNAFNFHQLTIDDCMHEVQRPKIESYGDYVFLIARHIAAKEKKIETRQISIYMGKNYLVSVHKKELSFIDDIKKAILEGGHRAGKCGPDYLLYMIIDRIVDNYFGMLDAVEDEITAVEEEILKKSGRNVLKKIFFIKRNLLLAIKPVWPLREVLHALQSGSVALVSNESMPYFRDIYDHLINVIDLLETYRELLSASLETHLSMVSNTLNETVKVLTVLASLFMIPMLIASIYGMNFKVMPELQWAYGYPLSLVLMIISMALTYVYFKRKNWV